MAIWVDEFTFRGRQPGGGELPSWSLVLAANGTDEMEQPYIRTKQLTAAQAVASGRTLPAVISNINLQTLAGLEAAQQKISDIAAALEADDIAEAKRLANG